MYEDTPLPRLWKIDLNFVLRGKSVGVPPPPPTPTPAQRLSRLKSGRRHSPNNVARIFFSVQGSRGLCF